MAKVTKKITTENANVILYILNEINTKLGQLPNTFSAAASSTTQQNYYLDMWAKKSGIDYGSGRHYKTPYTARDLRDVLWNDISFEATLSHHKDMSQDQWINEVFRQGGALLKSEFLARLKTAADSKPPRRLKMATPEFAGTPNPTPPGPQTQTVVNPTYTGKGKGRATSQPPAAGESSRTTTLKRKAAMALGEGGDPADQSLPSKRSKPAAASTRPPRKENTVKVSATPYRRVTRAASKVATTATSAAAENSQPPNHQPAPTTEHHASSNDEKEDSDGTESVSSVEDGIGSMAFADLIPYIHGQICDATDDFFKHHHYPPLNCNLPLFAFPELKPVYTKALFDTQRNDADWKTRVIELQKHNIFHPRPFFKAFIWAFLRISVFSKEYVLWGTPYSERAMRDNMRRKRFLKRVLGPLGEGLAKDFMMILTPHREQMDQTLLPRDWNEVLSHDMQEICQDALVAHGRLKARIGNYEVRAKADCPFSAREMSRDEGDKEGKTVAFTVRPALMGPNPGDVVSKGLVLTIPDGDGNPEAAEDGSGDEGPSNTAENHDHENRNRSNNPTAGSSQMPDGGDSVMPGNERRSTSRTNAEASRGAGNGKGMAAEADNDSSLREAQNIGDPNSAVQRSPSTGSEDEILPETKNPNPSQNGLVDADADQDAAMSGTRAEPDNDVVPHTSPGPSNNRESSIPNASPAVDESTPFIPENKKGGIPQFGQTSQVNASNRSSLFTQKTSLLTTPRPVRKPAAHAGVHKPSKNAIADGKALRRESQSRKQGKSKRKSPEANHRSAQKPALAQEEIDDMDMASYRDALQQKYPDALGPKADRKAEVTLNSDEVWHGSADSQSEEEVVPEASDEEMDETRDDYSPGQGDPDDWPDLSQGTATEERSSVVLAM